MIEHSNPGKETLSKRKVILFSGLTMGEVSLVPVIKSLQDIGPVTTIESVISAEFGKASREDQISQEIKNAFEGEIQTTFVLYSLGAAEFLVGVDRYLKKREKSRIRNNQDYKSFDLSNIQIVLRSPAGLVNNWRENWTRALEYSRLLQSQTTVGPYMDLEHLLTFSPRDEHGLEDKKKLKFILEAFSVVYADKVTVPEISDLPLDAEDQPDYFKSLVDDPSLPKILKHIDEELSKASLDVNQNPEAFKRLLKERTKFLGNGELLRKLLANHNGVLTGEDWNSEEYSRNVVSGLLGLIRVMRKTFMPGNIEYYRWFVSKNAKISLIIPEAEIFMNYYQLRNFFVIDLESNGSVPIHQQNTIVGSHITLSNRPGETAHSLKELVKEDS